MTIESISNKVSSNQTNSNGSSNSTRRTFSRATNKIISQWETLAHAQEHYIQEDLPRKKIKTSDSDCGEPHLHLSTTLTAGPRTRRASTSAFTTKAEIKEHVSGYENINTIQKVDPIPEVKSYFQKIIEDEIEPKVVRIIEREKFNAMQLLLLCTIDYQPSARMLRRLIKNFLPYILIFDATRLYNKSSLALMSFSDDLPMHTYSLSNIKKLADYIYDMIYFQKVECADEFIDNCLPPYARDAISIDKVKSCIRKSNKYLHSSKCSFPLNKNKLHIINYFFLNLINESKEVIISKLIEDSVVLNENVVLSMKK